MPIQWDVATVNDKILRLKDPFQRGRSFEKGTKRRDSCDYLMLRDKVDVDIGVDMQRDFFTAV